MSSPEEEQQVAEEEQQIAPEQTAVTVQAEEAGDWLDVLKTPIFGGASALQLALLLAVGTVWSASLWLIVDRIKDGLGLKKPYSKRARVHMTFGPLVASIVVCVFAVPATLQLAGVSFELDLILGGGAIGCGVVAWAGAKFSHDLLGDVLSNARDALVNRIRSLGGEKVRGYTKTHDVVDAVTEDADDEEE